MQDNIPEKSEYELSPREMRTWLATEITHATKALQLRLKEATDIANAYCNGEITVDEAIQRQATYQNRWHESLPGLLSIESLSDFQIVSAIDEVRGPAHVQRILQRAKDLANRPTRP